MEDPNAQAPEIRRDDGGESADVPGYPGGKPQAPGQRGITNAQASQIQDVREARANFALLLHNLGGTDPEQDRMGSANLTLALRHLEDAEYRAVRHITGGPKP